MHKNKSNSRSRSRILSVVNENSRQLRTTTAAFFFEEPKVGRKRLRTDPSQNTSKIQFKKLNNFRSTVLFSSCILSRTQPKGLNGLSLTKSINPQSSKPHKENKLDKLLFIGDDISSFLKTRCQFKASNLKGRYESSGRKEVGRSTTENKKPPLVSVVGTKLL